MSADAPEFVGIGRVEGMGGCRGALYGGHLAESTKTKKGETL